MGLNVISIILSLLQLLETNEDDLKMVSVIGTMYYFLHLYMIVESEFSMNDEGVADNDGVVEYRILVADLQVFEEQEQHRERMNG